MPSGDLVEADFLVCCNHGKSPGACTHTVEALRDNFLNISEISAVKPFGDTEDMCVTGTAMIRPSMRAKFEKDLKEVKIRGKGKKITKAVVTLPPK